MPVNELESRLGQLAAGNDVVFICLSGKRSQAACALALRSGLRSPGHLEGGMLAWQAAQGDG